MTTTAEPQQAPASEPTADLFGTVDDTARKVAQITDKPPSPMPLPAPAGNPVANPANASGSPAEPANPAQSGQPSPRLDPKEFAGLKDYKNRAFDPRLHRVKANGQPELTSEGKLKLLPPSKRGGIGDTVRNLFNLPKSDHELTAEQESTAAAQARSISVREQSEASARFWTKLYFAGGNTVFGTAFSNTRKAREDEIRTAILEYELETGEPIKISPKWALLGTLAFDISETVISEPECRERVDLIRDSVVIHSAKASVRRSWFGKALSFVGLGPKRQAVTAEPAKRETPERQTEIPSHLQAVPQ